ncbi:MAG TPA: GNAT family N-acetyltransferase, partial [Symbiobacteriaceae bacterium]|nr:GNAT family N-acetyltransferase [Symbiobacteriaceae bacterium]
EAKSFMTYETWERFMFDGDDPRTDWVVIAADGDRLVGVTQMVTEQDHVYTNNTMVEREYRGRGIALALKLLTIQAALKHGAPYMSTGNDSLNGPMLAVNRKLGYKPLVGGYTVVRHL